MNEQKLVGKIAADINSRKLGKIVNVEKIQNQKTRIWNEYALIFVKKFLKKDVVILIDVEKIIKIEDFYVWFDILKEVFDQEVKETRALIKLSQK